MQDYSASRPIIAVVKPLMAISQSAVMNQMDAIESTNGGIEFD